jgi:hypothetical protein
MDIQTTIKYLDFVAAECERHLKDDNVSDDELNQLIIEFQRFQDKIKQSSIPKELKNEIRSFKFDYNSKNVKRSSVILILSILTLGSWAYLLEYRRQKKRKETLEDLKRNSSTLGFKIRLDY